jgi:hypothetical protein
MVSSREGIERNENKMGGWVKGVGGVLVQAVVSFNADIILYDIM